MAWLGGYGRGMDRQQPAQTSGVMVTRAGREAAGVEEVERLWAAATAPPPLAEPPEVAAANARLYGRLLRRSDLITVEHRDQGELIGFAYGHTWHWPEQTDPWASQLHARLGATNAAWLEGSFAVYLLAVHPRAQRRGLGRRLLRRLLAEADARRAFLQTTDTDTPALRMYRGEGWTILGPGPDAPDGRPGLVLIRVLTDNPDP